MAEATHAVADWCEDMEMLATYLDLAACWIKMADQSPRAPNERIRLESAASGRAGL